MQSCPAESGWPGMTVSAVLVQPRKVLVAGDKALGSVLRESTDYPRSFSEPRSDGVSA